MKDLTHYFKPPPQSEESPPEPVKRSSLLDYFQRDGKVECSSNKSPVVTNGSVEPSTSKDPPPTAGETEKPNRKRGRPLKCVLDSEDFVQSASEKKKSKTRDSTPSQSQSDGTEESLKSQKSNTIASYFTKLAPAEQKDEAPQTVSKRRGRKPKEKDGGTLKEDAPALVQPVAMRRVKDSSRVELRKTAILNNQMGANKAEEAEVDADDVRRSSRLSSKQSVSYVEELSNLGWESEDSAFSSTKSAPNSEPSIYTSTVLFGERGGPLKMRLTKVPQASKKVSQARKVLKKARQIHLKQMKPENKRALVASSARRVKRAEESQKDDVEIIGEKRGEMSPSNECGKVDVKLAPVFLQREDLERKKARREFLSSGIPNVLKKMQEAQQSLEMAVWNAAPFPEVSHVLQNDPDSPSFPETDLSELLVWKKGGPFLPPALVVVKGLLQLGLLTNTRSGDSDQERRKAEWKALQPFERSLVPEDLMGLLERCEEKKRNAEGEGEEKKKRGRPKKSAKKRDWRPSDLMWTDKYKPAAAQDVVGNETVVQKLKLWLEEWKKKSLIDPCENKKNNLAKKKKGKKKLDDSLNDFCTSSSDSEEEETLGNTKLLVGPSGVGKTATVYALAKELHFKVLEVNASSRRNGRQVLLQLQEATKSHRVVKSSPVKGKGSVKSFFTSDNKKKKSKVEKQSDKAGKISLILFEDVDLVFEDQDEHFLSAVSSFMANTQRPIVLTSSNPKFLGERIKGDFELLHFEVPSLDASASFLQAVCWTENVAMERKDMESFLENYSRDLRCCLLNLQIWILSCQEESCGPSLAELFHLPMTSLLEPNPQVLKRLSACESDPSFWLQRRSTKKRCCRYPLPSEEANSLPTPSSPVFPSPAVSFSVRKARCSLDSWCDLDVQMRPFVEEEESQSWNEKAVGMEICSWLGSQILLMSGDGGDDMSGVFQEGIEEEGWRQAARQSSQQAASFLPPWTQLSHRAMSCDYLPGLRSICRVEEERLVTKRKRGGRFHHYLTDADFDLPKAVVYDLCNSLLD